MLQNLFNHPKTISRLWNIFSISTALFLLYISFRHVSLVEVKESFSSIPFVYITLASSLVVGGLFLRTVRWYIILPFHKNLKILELFRYFLIGCMLNNTMPARLGDVTKAIIVGKNENLSKSMLLATFVTERIFDLCSVLILFCVGAFLLPSTNTFRKSAFIAFIVVSLIIMLLMFIYYKQKKFLNLAAYFLKPFPDKIKIKVLQLTQAFLTGFEILSRQHSLLQASIISLSIWFLACLPLFILFKGFHLPLSFTHAIFLLSVISLGIMIPLTPGNIGTMQFVCTYALISLNVDKHIGFLFSVLYHAIQFIPVTLIGLYFFVRIRLKMPELKNYTNVPT